MKKLTKKQAVEMFKEEVLPFVVKEYGNNDTTAKRTAWNDFTDMLCKNGEISEKQYDT